MAATRRCARAGGTRAEAARARAAAAARLRAPSRRARGAYGAAPGLRRVGIAGHVAIGTGTSQRGAGTSQRGAGTSQRGAGGVVQAPRTRGLGFRRGGQKLGGTTVTCRYIRYRSGAQKLGGTVSSATAWTRDASSLSAGSASSSASAAAAPTLLDRVLGPWSPSDTSSSAGARSARLATADAALAVHTQKLRPCTSSSTYGVMCAP